MKLYVAIDLHSNNNVIVVLDETDKVLFEKRLPNDLSVVLEHLNPYKDKVQAIAVESTYNWYWLADGLMEAGYNVKLVNTLAVKNYDGLKYTGDEHDARHLAHLLRLGLLPTGYIYPKQERAVRDLLRKRAQLVRNRTMHILSVQNLIIRNSAKRISADAIRKLNDEALNGFCAGDAVLIMAIKSSLAVLFCLDDQIKSLERAVLTKARLKPEFKVLLSICGVGEILGMTIMYETGPIERFAEVGQFASYARCVESNRWSNGKKKGEGNRKNGNKYLAWAFVEAAHYAMRYNERIRSYYQRKKARTNGAVAVKAVAHKLARACYHMIKDRKNFEEALAFA
ncbi:MAG TPA: IS110 family transposase [Elusimicrobia bacterium]|nr:IS110 family transposase [Elusimicrobiota bacterium]